MADEDGDAGWGFAIGGTPRRATAEDLAGLNAQLAACQARVDELAGDAPTAALECDPRHRTLPEHMASFEASHAADAAALEEARSELRALEIAIEEGPVEPRGDAGLEEQIRLARARVAEAEQRVEHSTSFIEHARERLPEDDEAEAQARLAEAEMHLHLVQSAVDDARADLLPERCRDALELVAAHAADEWLFHHGPSDPRRRAFVRPQILMNIQQQLAATMFRPQLAALDLAINITGELEPDPREDAQPSDSSDLGQQLANTLNRLRFGVSDEPGSG